MANAKSSEPQAATQLDVPAPTAVDQDSLTLKQLARAVLDRSLKPRTAAVRRLAEAVLAGAGGKKKSKQKNSASSPAKSGKKGGGKKRKLAKIPQLKE